MRYKTVIVFKDGKRIVSKSINKINEVDLIRDARSLMREAGLDSEQPITKIKSTQKFLFFYI